MENNKLTDSEKRKLYEEIVPIAEIERRKIVGDNETINNTFQLLEQLGFFLLRFPSKDENLSGFHINKSGINCVYINSAQTLGRQYFSAWHEYYHAVTGEGGSLSFNSDTDKDYIEYKAECFAGCILMPENIVKQFLKEQGVRDIKYISHKNIILFQKKFSVSYSSVITRLMQIYPDRKKELGSRYALGNKAKDLESKTINFNGNLQLIKPTNDVYVSQVFLEDIKQNALSGKISSDKVDSLLNLLGNLNIND